MMSNDNKRIPTLGVTGSSGSGKSAVSDILAEYGGYIINADELVHQAMRNGQDACAEIVVCFGESVLDTVGDIDRKKLGAIVWNDRDKLNRLMEITHRHVIVETHAQMKRIQESPEGYRFIVLDAPLLVESGMHREMDAVWLIHAEQAVRMERIMVRDGISEEAALTRIRNQTPVDELRAYADVVIENTGGLPKLKEQISDVLRCFLEEN